MKFFAYTLILIGILNFTSFVIVTGVIGGDAVNGKTEGGRYFVSQHGHDTEVSRPVFVYSRFHAHSVWVTHSLAMFGVLILYAENQKRKARPAA